MSDNEPKFAENNPENQKPYNISGKNPRSVQNLHKAQVKPKSQDKDITIEFVDSEKTEYKTKSIRYREENRIDENLKKEQFVFWKKNVPATQIHYKES